MNRLFVGILALVLTGVFPAAAADFRGVLADIDRMSSFTDSDFSCLLTVVSEKPGEQTNI